MTATPRLVLALIAIVFAVLALIGYPQQVAANVLLAVAVLVVAVAVCLP